MARNPKNVHVAVDFGGGSGRVIAGWLEGGQLKMEEVHRFGNRQVKLGNHLYWDFPALFEDMKEGLRLVAQRGLDIKSVGIDTWGVDFGLIDKDGNLLSNPVCYRDARTQGIPEKVFQKLDLQHHYAQTGIQVMEINTLFQLYSLMHKNTSLLDAADHLLLMPDLFSYFLTGVANNEYSIASTSELLDARKRTWCQETLETLGLPTSLFKEIVQPGTVRGKIKEEIAEELGLHEVAVVAVGSHDTASAVAAVPATPGSAFAYLSSGTWSLLGVELEEPILTEAARRGQFTNEGGVGGHIRFLQNITGLWILQRLMAEWKERGEEQTYDGLLSAAEKVQTDLLIPVDHPSFMNPESMEKAILDYFRDHGKKIPEGKAEITRCVLQSLAHKYQEAVHTLNQLLPRPLQVLHIIGGGSQNRLLNQLTANATGIPVKAGPVEATAMGNILTQAIALKEVANLDELREIVQRSVTPVTYFPQR